MSKQRHVAIVQTSAVSTAALKQLFAEIMPDVKIHNIIDDSLIDEVNEHGAPNANVVRRMANYYQQAESLGVDCILNQCSSVGEVADICAKMVNVPVIKIDRAMADKAVSMGKKIALIATCQSTLAPSSRLIETAARDAGKEIKLTSTLVDGAMMILIKTGNVQKHNEMVLDTVRKAAAENDVVVLAQGSMLVLEPLCKDMPVPVLTSPRLGVLSVKAYLDSLDK